MRTYTEELKKQIVAEYLKREDIRVPEDVQIIGYDGIRNYSGRYHCSTIVQPIREIAKTCVELILAKDRSNLSPLVLLPVKYAYGGTTRD